MKRLISLILLATSALAQEEGSRVIQFSAHFDTAINTTVRESVTVYAHVYYSFEILRNSDGSKTFRYVGYNCSTGFSLNFDPGKHQIPYAVPICTSLDFADAAAIAQIAPVAAAMKDFYSLAPEVPHYVYYGPFSTGARPRLSVAQPLTQPNPSFVALDGFTNTLNLFDATNLQSLATVVVPSTSGPLAIRPTTSGTQTEVWVANGSVQVSVADLSSQALVTNIKTPALSLGTTSGIVFTPSGRTALEAVTYFSPDSSGNLGALVAFDATSRTVTSTLPLAVRPSALLMAPDGLTAYLLDDTGKLIFYDIFSGTADLVARTDTPGVASGYSSPGNIFIHPDGTRLFWNQNRVVYIYDLTTRKLIKSVTANLPTTAGASMVMSPDGSTLTVYSGSGDVVVLDTHYANVVASYKTDSVPYQILPYPVTP